MVKNPGSNQCQLIPGEVTESDTVDKTTKPQQIRSTDELKVTVEHIPDDNEILQLLYVNEETLNCCPQVLHVLIINIYLLG